VVEILGKQYRAEKGALLKVDKLRGNAGEALEFDSVLLIADNDQVKVGTPFVAGARVKAVVEDHGRDRKVLVYKYKRRKDYHKMRGHRQHFTMIRIQDIEGL
jgi:large subunit ribosomal protein L21